MKFNCVKHGPIDYILLNGYSIGDRLLEDVMFQVTVEVFPDESFSYRVIIDPDSEGYFSQFNQEMWLERAGDSVLRGDFLQCSVIGCREDVAVDPWNEKWVSGKLYYDEEEVHVLDDE